MALNSSNASVMERLAVQVSTPSSALYRHYLRPGQVTARFGANPTARAALSRWLHPGILAGGGGISQLWRMPPWQRGFDTSGNASGGPCHAPRGTTCREVPDVSALANGSAHDGYLIYGTAGAYDGRGWVFGGGTSLASPLWAALAALADQQTRGHRLGLLSPALYQIDRADPVAFHDVTAGGNNYLARRGFPNNYRCRYRHRRAQSCYRATKGYDMAAGLGTPNAARLVSDFRRSS